MFPGVVVRLGVRPDEDVGSGLLLQNLPDVLLQEGQGLGLHTHTHTHTHTDKHNRMRLDINHIIN